MQKSLTLDPIYTMHSPNFFITLSAKSYIEFRRYTLTLQRRTLEKKLHQISTLHINVTAPNTRKKNYIKFQRYTLTLQRRTLTAFTVNTRTAGFVITVHPQVAQRNLQIPCLLEVPWSTPLKEPREKVSTNKNVPHERYTQPLEASLKG